MSTALRDDINSALGELLPRVCEFLRDIIAIPSLPGREQDLADHCADVFSSIVDSVEKISISDAIRRDPDYASPLPDVSYDGRNNLRLRLNGTDKGRSLLICAHLDVVPASHGQIDAFSPTHDNGIVRGRGACDDKGQIAVIYMLLLLVRRLGVSLGGDLIVDLVVEEEIGGNGALAVARDGISTDGAVVMEPTNLAIMTAARGALWFAARCTGVDGHSGTIGTGKTALETVVALMQEVTAYHKKLLDRSVGTPPFEGFENPMPLTFGRLRAGDWPSMKPSWAVMEGVMGFLPNSDSSRLRAEIVDELRSRLGEDVWANVEWRFTVSRDPTSLDTQHCLVRAMAEALEACGRRAEISVFPALTDACFYQNYLGIPTVIFGVGEMRHAHSKDEQVRTADIAAAVGVLFDLVEHWCSEQKGI